MCKFEHFSLNSVLRKTGEFIGRTIFPDSYETADSYESDLSSYYSATEFDDGTSKPGFKRKLRPLMVKGN